MAMKLETGAPGSDTIIYWLFVLELEPAPLVTVSDTSYCPAILYVMAGGVCREEDEGEPPGKLHCQVVGVPVEISVNNTCPPAGILVGLAVKLATGGEVGLVTVI